jgi:hypothetical protein
MSTCNTPLPNIGSRCRHRIAEIYQLVFTSTYDNTGALNKIALSDAVTLANWQAKFNIFNFSATPLSKFVPTGRWHLIQPDQQDAVTVDEGGYYVKLAEGRFDYTGKWNNPSPYQVKQLKEMETGDVSIYMIDADGRIFGRKEGTDLYPIALQMFMVQNYNPGSYEAQAAVMIGMSLENPKDMNDLWAVELASGNPNSQNDFYNLINCSATVSTPAVTGCIVDIAIDETGDAVTGLATSGTTEYTKWKFVSAAGVVVSLAADTSVTESSTVPGRYTVNEATLLTSGTTYSLQISIAPFDILKAAVVVP